jgi:ATP-binding cassette subfamily F protein 3
MSLVTGKSISFTYPSSSQQILSKIDFTINPESKIGLIGQNGCGKTTLFKILSGEISDFSGRITFHKKVLIAKLDQELKAQVATTAYSFLWSFAPDLQSLRCKIDSLENSLDVSKYGARLAELYGAYQEKNGFHKEALLNKTAAEFGFTKNDLLRNFESFSGGEKTRLALARILLNEPDLLLFDEPTNHLDIDSLEWLEDYLQKSKIPFVVISHDRRFLDKAVNEIWEIKNRSIRVYSGNYSFFKDSNEKELTRNILLNEQKKKEISRLRSAADRQRTEANKMENFTRKRDIGKNGKVCKADDGSGKAALRTQNKQRAANAIEKRLSRKIEAAEQGKVFIEKERKIQFSPNSNRKRFAVKLENLSKAYGDKVLFSDLNLAIETGQKIAICGPNGSGKTTLLKILHGELLADSGAFSWAKATRIGYYSQEFETLNHDQTALDEVLQGNYQEQTRARTIMGCLKLEKDMALQKISTLSIGEKSKTALAKILFAEPEVLLLDEPTNHLEISARESLEEALQSFDGTVIFISHDRYFVEKIAETQIILG